MELKSIKRSEKFDRLQIDIRMIAPGMQEPSQPLYRKNGVEQGVSPKVILKVSDVFPKTYPIVCCDHAQADDRHKIRLEAI